jgi:hypothetical protein
MEDLIREEEHDKKVRAELEEKVKRLRGDRPSRFDRLRPQRTETPESEAAPTDWLKWLRPDRPRTGPTLEEQMLQSEFEPSSTPGTSPSPVPPPTPTDPSRYDWFRDAPAGRITKAVGSSWAGLKPVGGFAHQYIYDPSMHFLTGMTNYPEKKDEPPPEPPKPTPTPTLSAAPSQADTALEIWKGMLTPSKGTPISIPDFVEGKFPDYKPSDLKFPKYERTPYPKVDVPQMAAPTKPDYTEADKLWEESKPVDRKLPDTTMALLMGLASGFDPRPGEKFGYTLGRMAGPGMKAMLQAEERKADVEAANAAALAQWKGLRSGTLSERASAAARLGTETSRIAFENAMALRNDLLDRAKWAQTESGTEFERNYKNLLFQKDQENTAFNRILQKANFERDERAAKLEHAVKGEQLGTERRRADAADRAAQASLMRAFSLMGDQTSTTEIYDLVAAVADISKNKLAMPPGLDGRKIDQDAAARFQAEMKAAPLQLQASYLNPTWAAKRVEMLRSEAIMEQIITLPPELRSAFIAEFRKARRRSAPRITRSEDE